MYRRSTREVSLSVPPRRYDLAGEVLAEAVDRSVRDGVPVAAAVEDVAKEVGRRFATDDDSTTGDGVDAGGDDGELDRLARVLGRHGYEPEVEQRELCLANCPFGAWPAAHTELVCWPQPGR